MDIEKADVIVAILGSKAPRAAAGFTRVEDANVLLTFDVAKALFDFCSDGRRNHVVVDCEGCCVYNLQQSGESFLSEIWKMAET